MLTTLYVVGGIIAVMVIIYLFGTVVAWLWMIAASIGSFITVIFIIILFLFSSLFADDFIHGSANIKNLSDSKTLHQNVAVLDNMIKGYFKHQDDDEKAHSCPEKIEQRKRINKCYAEHPRNYYCGEPAVVCKK